MKTGISFKLVMTLTMAAGVFGALGGCSGQQQNQDENLETTQQEGDAAQGNAANETAAQGEAPSDTDLAANGADINSATTDDAAQLDATLNGAGAANTAAAPMNPASTGAGNAAMPGAAAPAPAAPAAGGPEAPLAGGRVRYVKEGGVQVVNSPGGSPVFTLEQGDHPVTWEENGWLKLNTGMYVPADALSDQGVGRPGNGHAWTAK